MFTRSLHTTARRLNSGSEATKAATKVSTEWVKESSRPKIHELMSQTFKQLNEQKQDQKPINIHSRFVHKFGQGETYDPFDFTVASATFLNTRIKYPKTFNIKPESFKQKDAFTRQGVNPLDLYCSPYLLSRFISPGGKILSRKVTGLSQKNHNLVAKLIRRARAIGFLSSVHQDVRFVPTRNGN